MRENIVDNQTFWTDKRALSNDSQAREPASRHCADYISGLPNRAILDWYLEHLFALATEPPQSIALLVIALDDAEAMRLAYGDSVCNKFMGIVAQRFREVAKSGQFVAVWSADAFAFVSSKNAGRGECIEVANKLLGLVSEPIRIDGRVYFCSAKVGIAFANIGSEKPADMFHRAQTVVLEARLARSDPIRFANSGNANRASAVLNAHSEIQIVRGQGELCLH